MITLNNLPIAFVTTEVLLLDEPTSALDVSAPAEMLNLLADIRQRG